LGDILDADGLDLIINGSVSDSITSETDVMIDYTQPDVVLENVLTAIKKKVHVIVGTSGLSDEDYCRIDESAKEQNVGVIAAGNFSLTATLMQHIAQIAARHLPYWEIFDYASSAKPDAPSGTARELAFQLAKIRKPESDVPVSEVHGIIECRGGTLNSSQIHSIRVPGYYSSSEIVFGMDGQRLTIRHDSMSSEPYVAGSLLAARSVPKIVGLKRGLDSVLEL
jgi:4-hydroxy-tetrahydrodipicolinate reductase